MLGRDILHTLPRRQSRQPRSVDRSDASARRPPASTVFLNRDWLDADIRITTGFVEPHFFAGFSGGPKMVAPGLAGLETVMTLHDAQRIGHPNATWGVTEGNPVHDDVREIARMVPRALRRRRDAQPRAADHGGLRRRHPRPSTAPRARTPRRRRCVQCPRRSTSC